MAPLDQDKLADYKQQAMKEVEAAQAYLSDKGADLQTRYVEPALTTFRHHAHQRPLFTTFALVFGLLSFFPVLLFTLFAAGTVLAVGGAALVGAAVVIAWLVGSAALSRRSGLAPLTPPSAFCTTSGPPTPCQTPFRTSAPKRPTSCSSRALRPATTARTGTPRCTSIRSSNRRARRTSRSRTATREGRFA
ncbi:hypothetical protein AAT19DRAFT_14133 [Rhodotorula toruloides]|uniref:Uncharacterized protein n=1 Tax=Rhodotorula toruloides TaxID=5286 RepID=A0A2T0AAS8_RHOTO|nr:hypothetical protein AAT19DRAFT_14133 [Rhodotorula toruloides]